VDFYQSWSGSGLRGWTNTDGSVSLSNPGGFLNTSFGAQSQPATQAGIVRTNIISGVLPTNISFSIKAFDCEPSAARVYLHSSAQDRYWYAPLARLQANVWTLCDIPVAYSDAWICNPSMTESDFRSDMLSIDWVGVYVRRNGSPSAQNYGIDDFLIQGVVQPSGLSISGLVLYDGEQGGTIRVTAVSDYASRSTSVASPGAFAITNVPLNQRYEVAGYRDSNGNNTQDFSEACGVWAGNPVDLFVDDMSGVDFTLSDPTSSEGLPYWWLNKYFAVGEPGGSGGSVTAESGANNDADTDDSSNFSEYWAGTDPTNALSFFAVDMSYSNHAGSSSVVLSWSSIPNRTYGVWRSTSIGGGFTKIQSALPTTPPENSFEDLTATGSGPYFYRVEVEH
jgi:hypothetical protein